MATDAAKRPVEIGAECPSPRKARHLRGLDTFTAIVCFLLSLAAASPAVVARTLNGFIIDNASVPGNQILSGGPPRDGIPALTDPALTSAEEARYLRPDDVVLGIYFRGTAKAYPTRILTWHEIVNDTFDEEPVLVTFCPLCGTGIAFSRRFEGEVLEFGVSGLLYNSDLLMYDRQTESLWSQVLGEAIAGPLKGRKLSQIPVMHTTWAQWRGGNPSTLVLSADTGHRRDYDRNPYEDYEKRADTFFPVLHHSRRYPQKEKVLGLFETGKARAWPFAELKQSSGRVEDEFAGRPVTIIFDHDTESAHAMGSDGELLPTITAFWFAWYTFFPHTEVFEAAR